MIWFNSHQLKYPKTPIFGSKWLLLARLGCCFYVHWFCRLFDYRSWGLLDLVGNLRLQVFIAFTLRAGLCAATNVCDALELLWAKRVTSWGTSRNRFSLALRHTHN